MRRGTQSLQAQPWWTAADQAELDTLAHEFTRVALIHRARCPECSSGPWCDQLRDAFAAVEEWREGRILRSRATWLRSGQDLAEWEARLWPDGRPAVLKVVGGEAA